MDREEEMTVFGEPVVEQDIEPTAELVIEPVQVASVKQPTAHPTQKVSAMAYGGGTLAVVINWLRARFGIEFMPEDIELILLIGGVGAGYLTKERVTKV